MTGSRVTQSQASKPNEEEVLAERTLLENRIRGAESVVILPTLNEESGLRNTLRELSSVLTSSGPHRVEALVIDGGSTDSTLSVARASGIPVLHQHSKGKGAAVVEAFEWLAKVGGPYAAVLDADATYPPDRTGPALALLREGADLVIGVRHPVWGPPRDFRDMVHRAGNVLLSATASRLSRRTILDLCSGFWAIPTSRFLALNLASASFAVEAELVLKALRNGYTVYQIPVAYRERIGVAKLRTVADGYRIFLSIITHARRCPTGDWKSSSPLPEVPRLLAIGAISGTSAAIVESHPSRSGEATGLATALRGEAFETAVVLKDSVSSRTPEGPEPMLPTVPGSPLLISLPSGGSELVEARTMTVSIRSQRRQLSIQLGSKPESASAVDPLWARLIPFSRAGAYALANPSSRSPSRNVFRSRLDLDPVHRQRTLLSANGFQVTEAASSAPAPTFLRKSIDPPPPFGTTVR